MGNPHPCKVAVAFLETSGQFYPSSCCVAFMEHYSRKREEEGAELQEGLWAGQGLRLITCLPSIGLDLLPERNPVTEEAAEAPTV